MEDTSKQLKLEIKKREGHLTTLLEQIKSVKVQLGELHKALSIVNRVMENTGSKPNQKASSKEKIPSLTIAKACASIMEKLGGTVKVSKLAETLMKSGRFTGTTKNAYSSIMVALSKDKKCFEKVGKGEFRLIKEDNDGKKSASDLQKQSK